MKKSLAIIAALLLLNLAACGSGNDAKQSKDSDQANQPKKSVFDPYLQDVNKAKQVQGKLDAAQQKNNAQLQQAESANTASQPQSASPPSE
ncbi:MAG TPA: hypothetical protein VFX47_05670 [Gammaproteobacteria bacterium]|nr:hypothetical protein [Gammaproteobacteria bacterium]